MFPRKHLPGSARSHLPEFTRKVRDQDARAWPPGGQRIVVAVPLPRSTRMPTIVSHSSSRSDLRISTIGKEMAVWESEFPPPELRLPSLAITSPSGYSESPAYRRRLILRRIGQIGSSFALAMTTAMALAAALMLGGCAWQPAELPPGQVEVPTRAVAPQTSLGDRAAAIALQQVGTPYRYGGQTPSGFDCSGLVHYAYGQAGRSVPRTTGALWSRTRPVPRDQLRTGDLLFFSIDGKMQHVGLYVGDGRFAHAPSSGRTVTVESLSADFYRQAFLRGGRLH